MSETANTPKDPWDIGWDAVSDQPDDDAEGDALDGAMAAWAAGFDTSDIEARTALVGCFLNSFAHNLTLPQPKDDDQDPLDTPEKEQAFSRRKRSLIECLATAYAQWEVLEGQGKSKSDVSKAN